MEREELSKSDVAKGAFSWLISLVLIVGIIAGGYLFIQAMIGSKKEPKRAKHKQVIPRVDASVVQYQNLQPQFTSQGRVRSSERISLSAEASGKILSSGFRLKAGTSFRKGQVLVQLDASTTRNTYQSAVNNLMNAVAVILPDIKMDMNDMYPKWQQFFAELSESKLPAWPEIASDREKLFISSKNIRALYLSAKNARIQLSKHVIRAPFNGSVLQSNAVVGNVAGPGVLLATLLRTDNMEIEVPLSVHSAALIKVGQKVDIQVQGRDLSSVAKVVRKGSSINDRTQMVSVFLQIKNHKEMNLRDGEYISAHFTAENLENVMSIPRVALYQRTNLQVVKNGQLKIIPARIEYLGTDSVYISGNANPGDTVLVRPLLGIIEGMKVSPIVEGAK